MTSIINEAEKVPIINWFGREGLHFIQILTVEEQGNVKTAKIYLLC